MFKKECCITKLLQREGDRDKLLYILQGSGRHEKAGKTGAETGIFGSFHSASADLVFAGAPLHPTITDRNPLPHLWAHPGMARGIPIGFCGCFLAVPHVLEHPDPCAVSAV